MKFFFVKSVPFLPLEPEETIEMEPPKFIKPLVPQIIPEGEVAFLEAEVTSKPEAEFTWFRHGQKITADEELEVQITSGDNKSSLVLGELFEDDSGDYTVTAQNPIGRASSTATLLVEGEGAEEAEPPAFNPPLTPVRVMDGDEVHFTCRVTGSPKPRLLWLQNGRPIGHHREVRVTQTPDGHAGLEISEVFPEDAGDYTCIARNKAGEARTTANLAVECKSGPCLYFLRKQPPPSSCLVYCCASLQRNVYVADKLSLDWVVCH